MRRLELLLLYVPIGKYPIHGFMNACLCDLKTLHCRRGLTVANQVRSIWEKEVRIHIDFACFEVFLTSHLWDWSFKVFFWEAMREDESLGEIGGETHLESAFSSSPTIYCICGSDISKTISLPGADTQGTLNIKVEISERQCQEKCWGYGVCRSCWS